MSETSDERPLGDDVNLAAWPTADVPPGFADRLDARLDAEPKRSASRVRSISVAAAALAAAAAVALALRTPSASSGERVAVDRVEVALSGRALAVLEPGASVRWRGDEVEQTSGDVFYRVEPGARFRVHTPAGDVDVKGTCFLVRVRDMKKSDAKTAVVTAAATALAMVGVYEGKVAVSRAGERVELTAGQAAQLSPSGLAKGALDGAVAEFAAKAAATDEALSSANKNLVDQVGETRRRLEAVAAQKTELETKLAETERALQAARADGAAPKAKHDFDLGPEEWANLAKEGTVKVRMPCLRSDDWVPAPEQLTRVGLAPADAPMMKAAYQHSNERVWRVVRPLCVAALGHADVADRLGASTCQHLVLDLERKRDGDAADEAMAFVGEVRSGAKPMPGPNDAVHPVAKMFLALTDEARQFEAELAQSLGPDEAHRVTFSDDMCMSRSTWGTGGRKKR